MFFLQPNQKRLINSFNPLFFILFCFLCILIRTTAQHVWPLAVRQWDILVPFMVYFGQRRPFAEGIILALFTSHLYSLCSGAPIGVFAIHYLILFLAARLMSHVIYANTWASIWMVMLLMAAVSRITLPAVAFTFGHAWPLGSTENFVWWSILLNGVVGCAHYAILGVLDRVTFKAPRLSIELTETEI